MLFLCGATTSFAEDSDVGGPPAPSEVLGYWRMIPLSDPSINEINPWPAPFQWFAFYADGRLVSMAATDDSDYSAQDLEAIFSKLAKSAPTYRWDGAFLLVQYRGDDEPRELWGMNIFRRDTAVSKAGDVVMTLAGGDDGRPVYYRLLRRVE